MNVGCDEPREHYECGGTIIDDADFVAGGDGEEFWWNYRCEKCGETFREPREWMFDE